MPGQNSFFSDNGGIQTSTLDESDTQGLNAFLNDDTEEITLKKDTPSKKEETTPPSTTPPKKEIPKKGEAPKEEPKEEEKVEFSADEVFGDEEEEEELKSSEKEEGGDKEDNDYNTFSALSKELFELGIFTKEEDEDEADIDTPEKFKDRFEYEGNKKAGEILDRFIASKGEEYAEFFQSVFVEGLPPKEYLQARVEIQSIKDLDLTNEDNQKQVLRQLYRSQGMDPQKIETRISKIEGYGDLQENAEEAHEILLRAETKKLEDRKVEVAQQAERDKLIKQEYLQSMTRILTEKLNKKEFDGIPVNKQFAEEVGGYLTREKYQTSNGRPLTQWDKDILDLNRPENHELKVKMAMLLNIVKTDPTLSRITNRQISKESTGIFQSLKTQATKQGNNKTQKEEKTSSFFS